MESIYCFRYRNIYTLEGLTLHELALKLQDSLNSNGVSSVDFSDIDDPPNLASSGNMRFIPLNKERIPYLTLLLNMIPYSALQIFAFPI
jgi:hypothetical protein